VIVFRWLGHYWAWAGSNIGAMPACGLLALAIGAPVTYLLRDRIGRAFAAWFHKHHAPHLRAELAAMEQRLAGQAAARHVALIRKLDEHKAAMAEQVAPPVTHVTVNVPEGTAAATGRAVAAAVKQARQQGGIS